MGVEPRLCPYLGRTTAERGRTVLVLRSTVFRNSLRNRGFDIVFQAVAARVTEFARGPFRPSDAASVAARRWRRTYWLLAAVPPLFLFALEGLKAGLYHVARSPNMPLAEQLGLTFAVHGAWICVPRLVWAVCARKENDLADARSLVAQLAALGITLAAAHLFLFTLLRLWLTALDAWLWEPIHVLHNYGEVWLTYGAAWLMTYAVLAFATAWTVLGDAQERRKPTRYEVSEKGSLLMIPLQDIYWIKAAGNYVELHTSRGVKLLRKTLAVLEKELAHSGFLKAHRSALVNARHVAAVRSDGSGFAVVLDNESEAPLSRRRLTAFKRLLRQSV